VGLEVERAELVQAYDHISVAGLGVLDAVHQGVQVQDPVLLRLIVRGAGPLPGLQALKGHAHFTEQRAQALVADVLDHPLRTRKSASLCKLQVENGRSWLCGRLSASALICGRRERVILGGRPPR
jgi:hypothetical protein